MDFIAWIAEGLGINVFKLAVYSGLFVVVTGGVVGGAVAIKIHYVDVGRQQVRDEIATQNRETLGYVTDAISKVDACRSLARHWNTVDGVCEQP
jgi:hypothetical protein